MSRVHLRIVVFRVRKGDGRGLRWRRSVLGGLLGLLYPQPCRVWWGICRGRSGGDVYCGVCSRGGYVHAFGVLLRTGSFRPSRGGSVEGPTNASEV